MEGSVETLIDPDEVSSLASQAEALYKSHIQESKSRLIERNVIQSQ